MESEHFTEIIGTFCFIALSCNAYFIKGLIDSINEMRIGIVKITILHDGTIETVKEHKEEISYLKREAEKNRARLHSLEGGQLQVLQYIKDQEKIV